MLGRFFDRAPQSPVRLIGFPCFARCEPMLSGLLPLLRESPPYARIRGAVHERRPMWVQGPAGAEKAYLLGALQAGDRRWLWRRP